MKAQIETGGQAGDDGSVLDIEIDRLIGLLAADEDQAVVQSAIFRLVGIGPPAFGPLSEALYETEDVLLRLRTIVVLGISSLSHPEAVASLVAEWGVLVDPSARAAIERALCATLLILSLRCGNSQPEPERRGRKGVATGRIVAGPEGRDGGKPPATRRCGRIVKAGRATTIADREEVKRRDS
jgi:hypothetical protein